VPVPLGAVLGGLFGILFGVQFGGFVGGTPGAVLGVLLGILLGVPLGALLVAGSVYFLVLRLAEELGGGVEPYLFRFWLWRTHLFPRRATSFLDDATARILLRRVGGGYSFIHRLLLDYFAVLEMAPPSTSSDAHPVEP
jgi:hypothetical protein